ncbi:proton-conducting transporter transmembrane domain-containing protein [Candidatus Nitrospira bockiana]
MIATLLLLSAPLLAGLMSLLIKQARLLHAVNVLSMAALVVAEWMLGRGVLEQGAVTALFGVVYIDALALLILLIIAIIGVSCSLYMWSYLDDWVARGVIAPARLSRFFFLFHLFLFAMVFAVVANSLGLQWVAIEGTTLATTFLIAFSRKRQALEAGWKYLILCSVGIALALFGTVLTYYSSIRVLGDVSSALNVTQLQEVAARLDPHVLKLAFVFILVGYGTKVGLVPMHTWLPDAYSEAPAPVTAMLAGVLETVAVYAILRSKMIVDEALPGGFAGNLVLLFGLGSFGVAALFLLVQQNYKRLFAYSSIEHMGLAMIGFGAGGVMGTFGGLFHLLNHALAKALAFFAAGNVHRRYGTLEIGGVRGLAKAQPVTAVAILVAALALVGMPPFSLFVSETLIISSLATKTFASDTMHLGSFLTLTLSDHVRSLAIVSLFLTFAVALFAGVMSRISSMVWGEVPDGVRSGEQWHVGKAPLIAIVAVLVGFSLALPPPLQVLLDRAAAVLVSH